MKFINESQFDIEQEKKWGGIPEITEMDKLIPMLIKNDIPFDLTINLGRPQIWYPSFKNPVCDVICHWGSYGHESGLLEIMGLVSNTLEDGVEGSLTAEEVFERIKNHFIPEFLNKEVNLKGE